MNQELQNILEKVAQMYMKYGIKSITMDDVARDLSISKKTLYQYVADKNDLVRKVVLMSQKARKEAFLQLKERNLNAIEEMLEVHKAINIILKNQNPSYEYDLRKYYPEIFEEITNAGRGHMEANIRTNLEKGKREGLFRADLDVDIITRLQLFRMETICNNNIFTVEEFASPKIFMEIFYYHLRGIASEKGLEYIEKAKKEGKLE